MMSDSVPSEWSDRDQISEATAQAELYDMNHSPTQEVKSCPCAWLVEVNLWSVGY